MTVGLLDTVFHPHDEGMMCHLECCSYWSRLARSIVIDPTWGQLEINVWVMYPDRLHRRIPLRYRRGNLTWPTTISKGAKIGLLKHLLTEGASLVSGECDLPDRKAMVAEGIVERRKRKAED
jgi:hypothetical protein